MYLAPEREPTEMILLKISKSLDFASGLPIGFLDTIQLGNECGKKFSISISSISEFYWIQ